MNNKTKQVNGKVPLQNEDTKKTSNIGVRKSKEEPTDEELFEQMLRNQKVVAERVGDKIQFSPSILKRGDLDLLHPYSINVIQGKTGSHKSRLVSHLCSLLLSTLEATMAGIEKTKRFSQKIKIVYVDTERNLKDQLPFALQEIKKKGGYKIKDQLDDLDFISLIDVPRTKRSLMLKRYIDEVREKSGDKHLLIILDVVSDCISNFNSISESYTFIDMLNVMINQHDITFICIIHENPGHQSEKARGHLGTELMNKASCQIQIGYELDAHNKPTELIKVRPLKVRMGKAPQPFYLEYCDEFQGLVEAAEDSIKIAKNSKKHKANIEDVKDYLNEVLNPKEEVPLAELSNKLKAHFGCSHNTIKDRLKGLVVSKDIVCYRDTLPYFLTEVRKGRQKIYSLNLLIEDTTKTMF
ncbi:MAG: hypothetical protein ACPG49_04060 [Chitinophagales bacterium]